MQTQICFAFQLHTCLPTTSPKIPMFPCLAAPLTERTCQHTGVGLPPTLYALPSMIFSFTHSSSHRSSEENYVSILDSVFPYLTALGRFGVAPTPICSSTSHIHLPTTPQLLQTYQCFQDWQILLRRAHTNTQESKFDQRCQIPYAP